MLLIDAHVHIHHCFDLSLFLTSALNNFEHLSPRNTESEDAERVLMLTETRSASFFDRLSAAAAAACESLTVQAGSWVFERTSEDCSLVSRNAQGQRIYLIAGRQVVTAERLEVLALGTASRLEDGKALEATLDEVRAARGIPVIPWGFGKWMGKRGKLLHSFLYGVHEESGLFLGDNGGRPSFLSQPRHFELVRSRGIGVLPGSDPLPFPSEVTRAGSYGFMVDRPVDHECPGRAIKAMLREKGLEVVPYGKPERAWRFFRNQVKMQFLKETQR